MQIVFLRDFPREIHQKGKIKKRVSSKYSSFKTVGS